MLINCHDDFHGTWGEDHDASVAACVAAAEALSEAGLACRAERCEAAKDAPAACVDAIGDGTCR
jgi:hypothetical protein